MNNRYIFFTGAPGSKWSSVVKHIYSSIDIDSSDACEARTYWHDAETPGTKQLMHMGAYWDPGMEFSPDKQNWDKPFSGTGARIIKSHVFAHRLNSLKELGHPIVMVYRNDYECLEWWKLCGEFNITYPNYAPYYKHLQNMWLEIQIQNRDTMNFCKNNKDRIKRVYNNHQLCEQLTIATVDHCYDYKAKDIQVYVYK